MKYSTHKVKTDECKKSWLGYAPEGMLTIQQWVCEKCERTYWKVWKDKELLKTFG